MSKYKLVANSNYVARDDGTIIPNAPGNIDYAKYQDWLAEGNTPDPAETETTSTNSLSPTQLINRLTLQEQFQLATKAQTDAAFLLLLVKLAATLNVNLGDPAVVAGFQILVPDIMTQQRVNELLQPLET